MEELLGRGLGFLELGLGFGMAGLIVARRIVAIIFEAAIAHLRRHCRLLRAHFAPSRYHLLSASATGVARICPCTPQ